MRGASLAVLLSLAGSSVWAQQATTAEQPFVLHVYTNLVQIPTLVLNPNYTPTTPATINQFEIRLDSGPIFHPTKMHLEGEEPISFSILLDATGRHSRLLQNFAADLAQVAQTSLGPQDHVSLYAADCHVIRATPNVSAASSHLKEIVEAALAAPTLHDGKDKGGCAHSFHLWDAAASVMQDLGKQPGHRVLLLVTNGHDHKGAITLQHVDSYAAAKSITVFGLRDIMELQNDYGIHPPDHRAAPVVYLPGYPEENAYIELCLRNGGLILTTPVSELQSTLALFVSMLRGRYILEFPRPEDSSPGRHQIDVKLHAREAFITTASVEVPTKDTTLADDPSVVPTAPSPAILGKHQPKQPKPEH